MRTGPLLKDSISWKLTAPSAILFICLVLVAYLFANSYIHDAIDQSAELRAREISEIFNISIEADNSFANLTRTTKSVATFSDINNLYVVDRSISEIVVANNNIFTRKKISTVNDAGIRAEINRALEYKKNHFYHRGSSD